MEEIQIELLFFKENLTEDQIGQILLDIITEEIAIEISRLDIQQN